MRALSGLADVLAAQGDTVAAEAHRSEAAELLNAMNESAARLSL
ncbi:hypothetical protein [Streptomyces camelliae]|uniref:Uncharacterized protein n=1 Tax=Streptomyces camelliae TaxID=3004093 RepID=A0ABY7PE96_9ACTN|nr:hypothetical protein [Streptomyces sp. HUAS 2-6]WBO68948.1 hypothetical protein O1G22_42310 [Streptomyces sp. HUAS 2-6]